MRYRSIQDTDFDPMQALDLQVQRLADPQFDALPEREKAGRLSTSLAALKFYARSEHSFLADDEGQLCGFVLAQSVWQGDKPIVLIRTVVLAPGSAPDIRHGLLHACVKSAYDCAVYELHFPLTPDLQAAAQAEEAVTIGQYAICHLGTRAVTSLGDRLPQLPPDEV